MSEKKKINKNIINISIIIIIFIVLLIYMIAVDGWQNIISTLKNVQPIWVLYGLACMIVYWLLEALCLHIITKKIYKNQSFKSSLRVSMIGQLFNCITPFSSGGQPIQAIVMKADGKSLSNSATILLIKFIVFQATLVIYTLIIIIFRYTYFKNLVSNFMYLALIGFFINLVVIAFLIAIGINKKLVLKILVPIFKFLGKIKILKKPEEKIEDIKHSISKFHNQFKIIKQEKWAIFRAIIYTVVQLTVFFLVTYMVYKAFGQSGAKVIDIISAQAFLMMIMAFVPIPGAGIAAEGGFLIIFSTFFASNTINMATLFWRMYTFYLPIIVGTLFMIKSTKKEKEEILKRR
ncbi:MAG: lysylphosphatidylglycerol synthase transmembrane domain-containing protein [Clostridia bacterium]